MLSKQSLTSVSKSEGLDCKNAFSGVYLPSENNKKRYPIKDTKLKRLQRECVLLDDDIRWLVALISDSGMRLSEAVGLLVDDIVLDAEQPHITLIKHPHRRLKTDASERVIPLVGASLWAARRIKENTSSRFCFRVIAARLTVIAIQRVQRSTNGSKQ